MKTLSAKHFRHKVRLLEAFSQPDGYGGFTSTDTFVNDFFGYVYDKQVSILNSAGQRIIQSEKRLVLRKFFLRNDYKFVISGRTYDIVNSEENEKGTQMELTLNAAGV